MFPNTTMEILMAKLITQNSWSWATIALPLITHSLILYLIVLSTLLNSFPTTALTHFLWHTFRFSLYHFITNWYSWKSNRGRGFPAQIRALNCPIQIRVTLTLLLFTSLVIPVTREIYGEVRNFYNLHITSIHRFAIVGLTSGNILSRNTWLLRIYFENSIYEDGWELTT